MKWPEINILTVGCIAVGREDQSINVKIKKIKNSIYNCYDLQTQTSLYQGHKHFNQDDERQTVAPLKHQTVGDHTIITVM